MKKVYRSNAQVNMTDLNKFGKVVQEHIDSMQNSGLQVEVQYCPCSVGRDQICLNALILGYTMEDNQ